MRCERPPVKRINMYQWHPYVLFTVVVGSAVLNAGDIGRSNLIHRFHMNRVHRCLITRNIVEYLVHRGKDAGFRVGVLGAAAANQNEVWAIAPRKYSKFNIEICAFWVS